MAASVIRVLGEFGFATSRQPCFLHRQEEEELEEEEEEDEEEEEVEVEEEREREEEEEEEEGREDEDEMGLARACQLHADDLGEGPWERADAQKDSTNQLLRFAELISSDVQRYFGRRSQEGDIYGSERQRYHDDDLAQPPRVQEEEEGEGEGPEEGEGPNSLGPLANLFQEEQKSGRGLPMSQRRLPISFWTEPRPPAALVSMLSSSCAPASALSSSTTLVSMLSSSRSSSSPVSMLSSPSTSVSTLSSSSAPVSTLSSSSAPVSTLSSSSALVSMLSSSSAPVSMLSSSTSVSMLSSTPDFSDLLAHWASDRDNNNDFSHSEYQLP